MPSSSWLLGMLSLTLLGSALRLIWEARRPEWGARISGAVGLALLGWALGGRWLVARAFSPAPPGDPPSPPAAETGRLPRPDGAELYVELHGRADAPAILFTHGLGTDSRIWCYAKRDLADRFRVIAWDRRGLGRSRPPRSGKYDIETQARDLEAVLTAFTHGRAILVGHSLGGMATLTFCRLFPGHLGSRVAGLVLMDTSARNPYRSFGRYLPLSGAFRAMRTTVQAPLLHLTVRLSPVVRLMDWLGYLNGSALILTRLAGFAGTQTHGQLTLVAGYGPGTSPATRAHESLGLVDYDEQSTLGRVRVPVLVVSGNKDRIVHPDVSRQLQQALPDARLVELCPAGHMSMLERHEDFVGAVREIATETLGARPA